MNKVTISEQALVSMVGAVAEVYDKEAYGTLLGHKDKEGIHIQYAIPYQTAIRKRGEVDVEQDAEERLLDTVNFLKGYKYLGEFHSHPDWRCVLSKCDKKDMKETGKGFSVLISINRTKRYFPWKYDQKEKCLIGSVRQEYLMAIKAYLREHHSKNVKKLRLKCPFIKKINCKPKKLA